MALEKKLLPRRTPRSEDKKVVERNWAKLTPIEEYRLLLLLDLEKREQE